MLSFGEVGVLDSEANLFFTSVLPFDGCSHLGGVGVVDPEAILFFCQCSLFYLKNRCFLILEACLVLMLLLGSESLALTSL